MQEQPQVTGVQVVPFRQDLAPAFRDLNREWIERHFTLEEHDRAALDDPHAAFIAPGGEIFFVLSDTGEALGACAVTRLTGTTYELAKMAVAPQARGRGYGDLLIRAAIDFARNDGAQTLMLQTNSGLTPALRLYRKHGFRDVPVKDYHGYTRADVQMELDLGAGDDAAIRDC